MIGEEAFKDFCSHAAVGEHIRALFITPNSPARKEQQASMFNTGNALGLAPVFRKEQQTVSINGSTAYMRIAHPYLNRELKELEWDFIHGLEYLGAFPEGERIQQALATMVRTHDIP